MVQPAELLQDLGVIWLVGEHSHVGIAGVVELTCGQQT